MSFYSAPTFNIDTQEWSYTSFEQRKDSVIYVESKHKYPSEYNLKYAEGVWNEPASIFHKNERSTGNGFYLKFSKGTVDHKKYWDFEKEKCAFEGFIIYKKPSEDLEYCVPGLYYWYLNYCPIPDKVKQKDDFPDIYDGDLHYYIYILKCILRRRYGVVLKKRQSGYSLKNMSIMLNAIWFGKSAIAKIFASDISKVEDSWSFMTKYRDHNNTHCAWKRGFDPTKVLDWQIRRKQSDGTYKGNNSIVKGFTTKQNATNGIGGAAKVIFGEEAGANPTLDKTHEFITSNVSLGGLVTGLIIYSGAVGELEQADPLKEFITHPEDHDFLGCDNNIEDDLEFGDKVGFFAPEWWNYVSVERDEDDRPIGEALKCFDENGNSNKPLALEEIMKWRDKAKSKSPEKYRYYCSQRPLSIKEAFAFRKESKFPQNLIQAQKRRIEDKQYSMEYVDIERDEQGVLKFIKTNKFPIKDFPVSKTDADKEGCIVIYERPSGYPLRPELGKFYVASIDPVKGGKTRTSLSLFSIIIYKLDVEVLKLGGELESWIEPGKIVAEWTGRFDDINKTHSRAQYMLEIYGAQAICEANVYQFVNHMITKKKQHYLVPKSHMLFLKEYGSNEQAFQDYGWQNTGKLFENNLLPSAVDFLKEEIGNITGTDGEIHKIIYGIERIPSIMLLKEMEMYQVGMNVDRLIAFAALCAYIKILLANRGYSKKIIEGEKKIVDKNLYAKPNSFFKTNKQSTDPGFNVKKSFFKHIK